jgi:DNA-binding IclR family transcriptional regulator
LADPVLRRIWTETAETVAMFVPQGVLRLCVAELPSPQPLNFKRGVGYTERIARGASGRAILAYMEVKPAEMRTLLQGTRLDTKDLEAELASTRKKGYATSHNELIPGAVAIAVPFFDRNGVAGSIGVFGPEVRMDGPRIKQLGKLLIEESNKLSAMLGYGSVPRTAT